MRGNLSDLGKRFFVGGVFLLIIYLQIGFSTMSFAQTNQTYPKIGIFHFGVRAPEEFYANFDFVVTSDRSNGFVKKIKKLNPNAIVLWTIDWNVGAGINNYTPPAEWRTRDSNGNYVKIYGGNRYLADITNFCAPSSRYNNKKYNEYLADYLPGLADLSVFDGISSSGTWRKPYDSGDIDLDRNGINDYSEHGAGWVQARWQEGIETAVDNLRAVIGNSKIIFFNVGGMQEFNSSIISKINGIYSEDTRLMYSYRNFKNAYNNYCNNSMTPQVVLIDGEGPKKDDFYWMRFWLGVTMLGDGYASFTEDASGEHHYKCFYDEYELDLGTPASQSIQIRSTGQNNEGVYVRFFTKGAVIVNIADQSQTIANADLRGFNQYDGPYYRFQGGQDPSFNNGNLFNSIVLSGKSSGKGLVGDAIILVKNPTTAVTDIIVDSDNDGTSPGSEPAQYSGNWVKTNDVDNAWCVNYRSYEDAYAIRYSVSKSNSATFTPTIGIAGFYDVYEWHGKLRNGTAANSVLFEIQHANGLAVQNIDQNANFGSWNYRGTFYFNKGNNGYVKIINDANQLVVADAIKFVYVGDTGEVDSTPPNSPRNLRSPSSTENSIELSWDAPLPASDGDVASSYQIVRGNESFITNHTTFVDTGLVDNSSYAYSVFAIDDYGNKSLNPAIGTFSTVPDQTPPTIDSVYALNSTLVSVVFSEPVARSAAETIANYSVTSNISVISANLLSSERVVQLTTSKHTSGTMYTLTVNNIYDKATIPNLIAPNTSETYYGVGDPIIISLSADNNYELYVNGEFLGSDTRWQEAETYYYQPTSLGKYVVAVKCWDNVSTAGLVAEIIFNNEKYVTDETWKISTVEETGWTSASFNDQLWSSATSYGLHGVAEPWAGYGNVQGISTNSGVKWIWSADNQNDKYVYFRFTLNSSSDQTPPSPPTGLSVTNPNK